MTQKIWDLESLFLNLLSNQQTQLISWVIICCLVIKLSKLNKQEGVSKLHLGEVLEDMIIN